MLVPMLLFLLVSAPAATSDATCDAKPFTLGTTAQKPATKPPEKPAPKLAEAQPKTPVKAEVHKPGPAGIAPCKDEKKK